eukprot:362643-Chlamydomonas_euryale.AAC.1
MSSMAVIAAFPLHSPVFSVLQPAGCRRIVSRLEKPCVSDIRRDEALLLEKEIAAIERVRQKVVSIELHQDTPF